MATRAIAIVALRTVCLRHHASFHSRSVYKIGPGRLQQHLLQSSPFSSSFPPSTPRVAGEGSSPVKKEATSTDEGATAEHKKYNKKRIADTDTEEPSLEPGQKQQNDNWQKSKEKKQMKRHRKKLELREEDLEEQFVRGGGKGGQKINKVMNMVLLTHVPTGIQVRCQDGRSLSSNRAIARKWLQEKVELAEWGDESKRGREMARQKKKKARNRRRAKKKMGLKSDVPVGDFGGVKEEGEGDDDDDQDEEDDDDDDGDDDEEEKDDGRGDDSDDDDEGRDDDEEEDDDGGADSVGDVNEGFVHEKNGDDDCKRKGRQ